MIFKIRSAGGNLGVRAIMAVIIIEALISCTNPSPYFTERVTTAESDGFVVNCAQVYVPGSSNECWQPARADVLLFEQGLKSFLDRQPPARTTKIYRELGKYKRHYEGYIMNKRRMLVTSFYHESTDIVRKGEWKRAPVGVLGGGDDYFTIKFDVERKEYREFWINADA